jgi:hypothetical protein
MHTGRGSDTPRWPRPTYNRNRGRAEPEREQGAGMSEEYQVQKAGLHGDNWTTICRGSEAKAREVFLRQVRYYSVGRFRLLDPNGVVLDEQKALPLFSGR